MCFGHSAYGAVHEFSAAGLHLADSLDVVARRKICGQPSYVEFSSDAALSGWRRVRTPPSSSLGMINLGVTWRSGWNLGDTCHASVMWC